MNQHGNWNIQLENHMTLRDLAKDAPLNGTFWHSYVSKYLWNTTDTHFNQNFMNNKYRQSPLTPNCTTAKNALDNKCFNDNNCFLYFLSDDNINCQKG